MKSLQSGLRTVDVARRAGYTPQQIRNLEHEGALPAATRTPSGYRTYTEVHVRAALAYRAFALAMGPVEAKRIMRATDEELLPLVDAAHARLHTERRDLQLAKRAAAQIASELVSDARSSDAMSIIKSAPDYAGRTRALNLRLARTHPRNGQPRTAKPSNQGKCQAVTIPSLGKRIHSGQ